jgi:hypothetical protein
LKGKEIKMSKEKILKRIDNLMESMLQRSMKNNMLLSEHISKINKLYEVRDNFERRAA